MQRAMHLGHQLKDNEAMGGIQFVTDERGRKNRLKRVRSRA